MKRQIALLFGQVVLLSLGLNRLVAADAPVTLQRTPEGGIQPQAALDGEGTLHLVYFKGAPSGGDLFYVRRNPDQTEFSKPIQVNTRPGTAIAAGTIRGAQMAVGRNGRIHVAWNGPSTKGNHMEAPMYYTRLNDAGDAFEPERDVITYARGLDGGGSVAADGAGNVYVFWHAPKPGGAHDEANRAVFVARSSDDGKTFAPEQLATARRTGACGCCGMKAFADSRGTVFALYRAAWNLENRDEVLLMSRDHGATFDIPYVHGWKIATCPMSSAFLSETASGLVAAAETHERVFFIRMDTATAAATPPVSPETKGKHPVAVANSADEVLLVWLEGTAWGKGGTLVWQIYDARGRPTARQGRAEGVPPWSLVAAVAEPDGGFVIIY